MKVLGISARPQIVGSHQEAKAFGSCAQTPSQVRSGQIEGYLGHKSMQHTVRHTELSATRFKDFWRA